MSQMTKNMEDDFEWIDNAAPETTESVELLENDNRAFNNVSQCETSNSLDDRLIESDEDDVGSMLDSDTPNSIDHYCEPSGIVKKNKRKPKLLTSSRKTVREHTIIADIKSIPRQPSYYNFDRHTCCILEKLSSKMGPLMNIAGRGKNSVVIYADCLPSNYPFYGNGYAVKVYKQGSDVKKNHAILKHIKNEEEIISHIVNFDHCLNIPHFIYRLKNVIVTSFIGHDQETPPSIETISLYDYMPVYRSIAREIDRWYNKIGIVHGNLSTKTVVYDQGVSVIGWSHAVRRNHPLALIKLMKDCHFVTSFFKPRGIPVKPEKLFMRITGLKEISSKVLGVLHKKDLWKDLRQTNPNKISEDSARYTSHRFK